MRDSYDQYLQQANDWKNGQYGKKNTFFMATKVDAVRLKNFLKKNGFTCSEIIWQQSLFSGFKFTLLSWDIQQSKATK